MTKIKKSDNQLEDYNEEIIYKSIYQCALISKLTLEEAEEIALKITDTINKWVSEKTQIHSNDLKLKILEFLEVENPQLVLTFNSQN